MSLAHHYREQLAHHGYAADPHQQLVVAEFERLSRDLVRKPATKGWFWKRRPAAVAGIYLWGGVGRGKTWLMDLFCSHHGEFGVERHHFHSFMRQMHEALRLSEGRAAPVDLIIGEMAQRVRVLCLDEFQVIDIGDAMLLRGLLEALSRAGVTLVTTSNQAPDDLYLGGIQRDSFLPAIEILKRKNRVIELGGEVDYRLQLFHASSVYHVPLGEDTSRKLELEFERLVGETVVVSGSYGLPGRPMRFHKRGGGVIWCDFEAICGPPRWQKDYLELARSHHTVFISDIPRLGSAKDDYTRRFINLVDVFYDRKVKLVISAESPPEGLYEGRHLRQEFLRTASRLQEMQSDTYLETPHRA
jgi:cell division protein ZapE